VEIKSGHSRLVDLPAPVKRVSVGKSEIADVVVINPRQLYVNGIKVGSTNISLWDSDERLMGVFEVRISRDLARLKEHLYQILPREPVEVRELEGKVVLSGRVSSLVARERAEAVAKAFAPKEVTSVIEIGGSQQVLLKVVFAEVSKNALKRMNFNLGLLNAAGEFMFTLLDGLTAPIETVIMPGIPSASRPSLFYTELDFSKNMNGMFGWNMGGNNRILGFVDALKGDGVAKILAEPNLVATSGKNAEFLAGGEYPIPVPQRDTIAIEFKKYGVQLNFMPEIMDDGRIRLMVEPEVSELDFSTAVVIESFTVPGLITRRAKTQLELNDGQSFAIAGLFRDDVSQTINKFPLLGDIPILGALFRSTKFQKKETELVIVVTPEVVKPGMGRVDRLPTDKLQKLDDFDIFLMGKLISPEDKSPALPRSPKELEGNFGHEVIY
jgi:pilus assembly protein CpaC